MTKLQLGIIITLATALNACAPQQSQELASLTCASSEDCTNVELDKAAEYAEHDLDQDVGKPSGEALAVQWQESLKPETIQMKTQISEPLPAEYAHLDPKKIVPARAFERAVRFFHEHKTKFKNQKSIAIIDFTQKSTSKRLYIVDLKTGAVENLLVAHGKGSDSDHDGYATKFSNINGSLMSSLGAYMTAETYQGKYGTSLRLDGLESTNSLARSRAVVMHAANYVDPKLSPLGRSFGCPAIEWKHRDRVISLLKGGSLLYGWYNQ